MSSLFLKSGETYFTSLFPPLSLKAPFCTNSLGDSIAVFYCLTVAEPLLNSGSSGMVGVVVGATVSCPQVERFLGL